MCSNFYFINKTWDGHPISHSPVRLNLESSNQSLTINIQAPFFNSPEKPGEPIDGSAFNLWDYEGIIKFDKVILKNKNLFYFFLIFKLWRLFF